MNLLYNKDLDSVMYDLYLEPTILGNIINDRIHYIQRPENLVLIDVPDTYKYRPERIALQYYGSEQYYPIILAANNIGSLLQFIPSEFNNKIKMVKSEVIQKLLGI
jgi:hypothetical protein